jgi:hypothetical protein
MATYFSYDKIVKLCKSFQTIADSHFIFEPNLFVKRLIGKKVYCNFYLKKEVEIARNENPFNGIQSNI